MINNERRGLPFLSTLHRVVMGTTSCIQMNTNLFFLLIISLSPDEPEITRKKIKENAYISSGIHPYCIACGRPRFTHDEKNKNRKKVSSFSVKEESLIPDSRVGPGKFGALGKIAGGAPYGILNLTVILNTYIHIPKYIVLSLIIFYL